MLYTAKIGNNNYSIEIDGEENLLKVKVNDKFINIDFKKISDTNIYSFIIDGRSYQFTLDKVDNGYIIRSLGKEIEVELEDERTRLLKSIIPKESKLHGHGEIKAVMPGLVKKVEVSIGDEIKAGQGLIILEAMKMENEIKSTIAGKVEAIYVKETQTVEKGQILVSII
jgi:pyruvate carboxylase subunit B